MKTYKEQLIMRLDNEIAFCKVEVENFKNRIEKNKISNPAHLYVKAMEKNQAMAEAFEYVKALL